MKLLLLAGATLAVTNALCITKNRADCDADDECRWKVACLKDNRLDMANAFDKAGEWMPTLGDDVFGNSVEKGLQCLATSSFSMEINAGGLNVNEDDIFKNLPSHTAEDCAAAGCSSCTLNVGLSMKDFAGLTGSVQVCGYLPTKYVSCDDYRFLLESGLKAGSNYLSDFTNVMEAFQLDFNFPTACENWKCTDSSGTVKDIGIEYSLPLKNFNCDDVEQFSGNLQTILADKFGFAAKLLPAVVNGCTDAQGAPDRHLLSEKTVTITLPGGQDKSAAQCASELSASVGAKSLGAEVDAQIDYENPDAIKMEFVESDVEEAEELAKNGGSSLSALFAVFSGIFALATLSRV